MAKMVENGNFRGIVNLVDDVDVLFYLADSEDDDDEVRTHVVINDYKERYAAFGVKGLVSATATDSKEEMRRKARLNGIKIIQSWCWQAREELEQM